MLIHLKKFTFLKKTLIGFNTYLIDFDSDDKKEKYHNLWSSRLKCVIEVLKMGYHLIMSDLEVVWIKSPNTSMFQQRTDIWASRGTFASFGTDDKKT